MTLHIAKPYLNLTDIKRCKFCFYATPAKHLTSHVGCKLHQTMVKVDYKCNQWLDPTGEIKVDEKAFEAPKNKFLEMILTVCTNTSIQNAHRLITPRAVASVSGSVT